MPARSILAYALIAAVSAIVLIWGLTSLNPGLSPTEGLARADSSTFRMIYSNPINGPLKLLQHLISKSGASPIVSLRLSSVMVGLFFGFCFYKLAVGLFGRVIGLLGSLIFISLPLFVIAARQGSTEIIFFAPICLMWLYAWLNKAGSSKRNAWLCLLLAAALLSYTPGLIWWMAGSFVLCRKRIISAIAEVPSALSAAGFILSGLIIVPLITSLIKHPAIIKHLFLVPDKWLPPIQIAKNIGWMLLALFYRAPYHDPLILDRLPLLNVLLLALLIFGIYAMQAAARTKAYGLGLAIIFAVLAAGLNNRIALLALGLPALAVFICAGLRYLYIEWRAIFPLNPVPKTFALIFISAVVVSQLYFGLQYALVAWPNSPATKTVYVLK